MRAVLACLFLILSSTALNAHGDFQWIADNNYRGNDGVHCCGTMDCEYIPEEWIELTNAGYVLHYKGRDILFNQWGKGLHVTQRADMPPIMCRSVYADQPRCIFIKPLGS